MARRQHLVDDTLQDWSSIQDRYSGAILIGNGSSVSVSNAFSYPSLFDAAQLIDRDRDLFDALDTTNFERVLSDLGIGEIVCRNSGHDTRRLRNQYRRIRSALVDSVVRVHVEWSDIPRRSLLHMRRAFREYDDVLTTNYDLLMYWAIMASAPSDFVDFFWGTGNRFDISQVDAWPTRTRVYYLHGGLHLVRDKDGSARKRVAHAENLLQAFGSAEDVPLFVSEGTALDKLRAIRSSDYLTFAFEALADNVDGMVVFGHSLRAQDSHIRRPLSRADRLAISIYPNTPRRTIAAKARFVGWFPEVEIDFFDATSHPLGHPSLALP